MSNYRPVHFLHGYEPNAPLRTWCGVFPHASAHARYTSDYSTVTCRKCKATYREAYTGYAD